MEKFIPRMKDNAHYEKYTYWSYASSYYSLNKPLVFKEYLCKETRDVHGKTETTQLKENIATRLHFSFMYNIKRRIYLKKRLFSFVKVLKLFNLINLKGHISSYQEEIILEC